jgi:hypothetical protein
LYEKYYSSTLVGIAIDKGYIEDVQHRLLDFFPVSKAIGSRML